MQRCARGIGLAAVLLGAACGSSADGSVPGEDEGGGRSGSDDRGSGSAGDALGGGSGRTSSAVDAGMSGEPYGVSAEDSSASTSGVDSADSGLGSGGSIGSSSGLDAGSNAGQIAQDSGSNAGQIALDSGSGSPREAGGAPSDGGKVWSPSAAEPIHFHWMIGGFTKADILPDQAGTVVYDVDGENTTAAEVAAIHAAGAFAVCYVDVGTLEQGRSDYNQFPASAIGPAVAGWPGENWLLVSAKNQSVILPLIETRFEQWCVAKGFDAIEPDNLDGWTNIAQISQSDNLAYDQEIANLAHAIPMSIGLKNVAADLSATQLATFVSEFDWALSEQCYEYKGCGVYAQAGSFIASGKAVFDVEYNVSPNCTNANMVHMNAQKSDLNLVGATTAGYLYAPCIPDTQTTW